MGITRDGWLDWAQREPGPRDKVYRQANAAVGYIPHSMVGWMAGWRSRLFNTERRADGRYTPYAAASVHGAILVNGKVIQHYPLTESCWASGSFEPNTRLIAFENEGGPPSRVSEPLTSAQVDANVRIIKELMAWKGWKPRRPVHPNDKTATLYEHNECTRWGSPPTACPSGRIPWGTILRRLEEDDMAAIDDLRKEMVEGFEALKRITVIRARQVDAVLEQVKLVNQLQQGWLNQHAQQHGDVAPAELADRVSEFERALAEVSDVEVDA